MWLINTRIMENKIHTYLKSYLLGTESSSLDVIIVWIIKGQLCGRMMKMGCILVETSKMVELDNNIKNNDADPCR